VHPGFPEEYIVLMDSVKESLYKELTKEEMDTMLKTTRPWMTRSNTDSFISEQYVMNENSIFEFDWALQQPKKGIHNSGNNCYMNSFLQALLANESFTIPLLSTVPPIDKGDTKSQAICKNLQILFGVSYFGNRNIVDQSTFKQSMGDVWAQNGQQDSFEFGISLLDSISSVLPNCCQCFEGKFRQTVSCQHCGKVSIREDSFNSITLQFPVTRDTETPQKTFSLKELLNYSFHAEEMTGDNKIQCNSETCDNSLQNGLKSVTISEAPDCFMINLASFKYDPITNTRIKIFDKKVTYSEREEVRVYSSDLAPYLQAYILTAVIIHSGYTAHSGHYYAYARNNNTSSNLQHSQWYKLNDSHVGPSNFNTFSRISEVMSSEIPYLLFYTKEGLKLDMNEMVVTEQIKLAVQQDNELYKKQVEIARQLSVKKPTLRSNHGGPDPGGGGMGGYSGGPSGGGGGMGFESSRVIE